MKHKIQRDSLIIIFVLFVACIALAVPLAFVAPQWLIAPAVLMVFVLILLLLNIRAVRRFVAEHLHGVNLEDSKIQYTIAKLPLPAALLSDNCIVWYNDPFRDEILKGADAVLSPAEHLLPGLDLAVCARAHGQDLTVGDKRYTAYASAAGSPKGGTLVCLVNDTFYKNTLDEYNASRPACLILVIDSYDELFNDMKDSEQAHELEAINSLLEEYIGRTTGFLRRVSNSRYIAVVEERDVRWMIEERFDILDSVRALHPGNGVTLSIGVGHGGETLQECHEMARESIDIALGRGGDQAAVKTADGFEFFGGISHGVEKRSHVRSRIIANALADQIRQSDSVIIMGHRQSDLDAIGSAIGILRMCKMCDVPSVIAVRSNATLAGQLIDTFIDAGEEHNFIEPEETYKLITPDTLLIVTDTYQKRLLEDTKIYEKCSRVVVIDHHRMAVGHIDNPILLYHEPYASSASELVCELLQFMPAQDNITPLEAQALLAGIMLDTRSFALHVGVRTFEAAAWLRSRGAETAETKQLFNISKEEYEARAAIVESAYIYKGCAIAISDELAPEMSVVLPMAANDLLTINGVDASFVAVAKNGGVNISARSMGALNVQVILEPLGGGGHLTMAGAQLKDCTPEEAEQRIREEIDQYREAQAVQAGAVHELE
ncbi:MAG: DHH family phosphoesterase [Gemmiger sp.]|uniref:DHH family phosphoesterase n=1 Tax=Gemmiger sp. TaxID=2049027 RepID=UPI002E77A9D7|nr:DHH family phosphoesterase [Gemmiger sp.]MEE0801718.1 DHH family phosphoesterase [Gemmiger sp.]